MGRLGRPALGTSTALLAAAAFAMPAAQARDAVVESFDGTPIVAHFFPAPGLEAGGTAPTIMLGHGWGLTGATGPPAEYAEAGYNVLTWDARGFGGSRGTVMIDHPDFEARDAQALIDFIAEEPEARLDSPGDPRVGSLVVQRATGAVQVDSATIELPLAEPFPADPADPDQAETQEARPPLREDHAGCQSSRLTASAAAPARRSTILANSSKPSSVLPYWPPE